MLTLTRKVGQTIRIGDDIEIVVRQIRGQQVRIGVVAPSAVAILRSELYTGPPLYRGDQGTLTPSRLRERLKRRWLEQETG